MNPDCITNTTGFSATLSNRHEYRVFTLPLLDGATGKLMSLLTCETQNQNTLFSLEGPDRAGVLAYVTWLFREFGIYIESCHGARLKHSLGSFFELMHSPENEEKARRMCDQFHHKAPVFCPRPLVPFDRVYDLRVGIQRDDCGLLYKPTQFLADHDVNVRFFRADKDDLGGLAGLPEVQVSARLEVPPTLELGRLRDGLAGAFPSGSKAVLREVLKLRDGRPVAGDEFYVVGV